MKTPGASATCPHVNPDGGHAQTGGVINRAVRRYLKRYIAREFHRQLTRSMKNAYAPLTGTDASHGQAWRLLITVPR